MKIALKSWDTPCQNHPKLNDRIFDLKIEDFHYGTY